MSLSDRPNHAERSKLARRGRLNGVDGSSSSRPRRADRTLARNVLHPPQISCLCTQKGIKKSIFREPPCESQVHLDLLLSPVESKLSVSSPFFERSMNSGSAVTLTVTRWRWLGILAMRMSLGRSAGGCRAGCDPEVVRCCHRSLRYCKWTKSASPFAQAKKAGNVRGWKMRDTRSQRLIARGRNGAWRNVADSQHALRGDAQALRMWFLVYPPGFSDTRQRHATLWVVNRCVHPVPACFGWTSIAVPSAFG